MTSPSIILDLHRARRLYLETWHDLPETFRVSKLTLRLIMLAAGVHDPDEAVANWEGGMVLGIPLILDHELRAGQILTEGRHG